MAQTLHPPQRYRGFILTAAGLPKLQARINQLEAQTRVRQSARTIAERIQLSEPDGIHPITVKKILTGKNGVDKRSIQIVFQGLQLQLEAGDYAHAGLSQRPAKMQPEASIEVPLPGPQDGSKAVNESYLCGRVHELTQLNQAIITEHCRLVQILGVAGVGKTALATMLAKAMQSEFEFVRWQSLHHAPAMPTVLTSILQGLIHQTGERAKLPTQGEALTGLLIETLQRHRCLLVFDHFDTILDGKQYAGYCRPGYEAYGELLQVIADVPHQSCLILTSRERPRAIAIAEAHYSRSLQLGGLLPSECQQVISRYYPLIGTKNEWRSLIEQYHGHPLALSTIAVCVKNYFNGCIADYLSYLDFGELLPGDLCDLLGQQFDRFSSLEQEIACHLARHREPISVSQLREEIVSSIHPQFLLEGLDSLSRRSFLHQRGDYFTLDPILRVYINECLVEQRDHSSTNPTLKIVSNNQIIVRELSNNSFF